MTRQSTIPTQRVPFDADARAAELHPAWCDSLDEDHPVGCGSHGSTPTHIVVTGGGYEVTDDGASFPLLIVSGAVETENGEPYTLVVEVTLLGPDRRGRLELTAEEAGQLANLVGTVQSGSVAATGGFPYGAVRATALYGRRSVSLSGGLNLVLGSDEAAFFCEALRASASLPVTPETFATWAEHRAAACAA